MRTDRLDDPLSTVEALKPLRTFRSDPPFRKGGRREQHGGSTATDPERPVSEIPPGRRVKDAVRCHKPGDLDEFIYDVSVASDPPHQESRWTRVTHRCQPMFQGPFAPEILDRNLSPDVDHVGSTKVSNSKAEHKESREDLDSAHQRGSSKRRLFASAFFISRSIDCKYRSRRFSLSFCVREKPVSSSRIFSV